MQQKGDAQSELLGVSLAARPLELIADHLSGTGAVSTVDAVASVGHRVTIAEVQQHHIEPVLLEVICSS